MHNSSLFEVPGCLRGRSPSVWERVQRKPFRRVSFGVFFLLQSVFFLARARKKMRRDSLAGFCQNKNGPWATARQSVKNLKPYKSTQTGPPLSPTGYRSAHHKASD